MGELIRVLVVDDSEDDTLLLMDELRDGGYDPVHLRVDTPQTMSDALREQSWDIIIADYTIPGFSGPAALQVLRDSGLDIPLILVSGTAQEHAGVEMMRAGARDFIMKHSLSRLAPAVKREVAEAEGRRQRRRAEHAASASEAQKREFYRRTLSAFTGGKLVIAEPDEVAGMAGDAVMSWEIKDLEDLSTMRSLVKQSVLALGLDEQRAYDFVAALVEAVTNALKHAGGGKASLHLSSDAAVFVVSDSGPGIEALALPDVALTKGYSTAATLGMGYKIMIQCADKVYLATGPAGTVVAVEVSLR